MRTFTGLLISIILLSISFNLSAQNQSMAIDYDRKAWIGLNIGGVWQSSDVRSQLRSGSGLTFDYYFIRNNTSVFGLGARAQYFTSTSTGLGVTRDFGIQNNTSLNGTAGNPDYASLPDAYVFQNHSTEIVDLSGNIILSLNKLRATTGLHLYLFGGIGGTGYIAKLDQRDGSGSLYDYTLIDPSRQINVIQDDLKNLRDDDFETFAESGTEQQWVLTPTVGAGFAFQLSPRVQLGFEHKVGFTRTDLLDGNHWDASGQLSTNNDVYHFSSISISIGVGKLFEAGSSVGSNFVPTAPPPSIEIIEPTSSLFTSSSCNADIRARVLNIAGKGDISVDRSRERMDPSEYTWNASTKILEIHESLNESTVSYSISINTAGGSASRVVIITCASDTPSTVLAQPPVIDITSPSSNDIETPDCMAQIFANISNVRGVDGIEITENGRKLSFREYTWNRNTKTLRISRPVAETSSFIIKATNAAGTVQEVINVTCASTAQVNARIAPPILNVVIPGKHPYATPDCVAKLSIRTENITDKNQITVLENGKKLSSVLYTFDSESGLLSLTRGLPGEGEYYIKAQNAAGTTAVVQDFICPQAVEREALITICHFPPNDRSNPQTISIPTIEWPLHAGHGDTQGACPVIEEPGIIINNPSTPTVAVENCRASINATVLNIEYKEDIEVMQNGKSIPFGFYGNTVSVNNIPFTGTSTFSIMVSNLQGTITKSVVFICQPKPVSMITICHSENGSAPQTLRIPATEWASHQAHGDTQGTCPVIERPVVTILSPSTSKVTLTDCSATLKATVTNIENKSNISVVRNGTAVPFTFASGQITVTDLPFSGTANFVVTARNSAGSSIKKVAFVCQPQVEMITICHTGTDGVPQTVIIPEPDWQVHASHGDTQGTCPVVERPLVTIILPSSSPITVENCIASVKATVENISDKQGLTITRNGTPIDFDFIGNTVSISNLKFNETANFSITAKNSAGTSVKSVSFVCQPPIKMITICHTEIGGVPQTISITETEWSVHSAHGDTQGSCPVVERPLVTIQSPSSSPVTIENCVASIRASVENVSDKKNISVTLNGDAVDFSFTGNIITLSNMSFMGTANFAIKATNSAGSSIKSTSFICKPPVEMITICHSQDGEPPQTISIPVTEWSQHAAHGDFQGACPLIESPIVTILSPTSSPVTVENCIASIQANVENVDDKQGITITQNGVPINFDFTGSTISISNQKFTGTSNFTVTAINASGTSVKTVSFVCEPPRIITICHTETGGIPQTISISESEWSVHSAHGDTQGSCPVVERPLVTIESPSSSPITLENCEASIRASVENVIDKQNISITQNDNPIDFNLTGNIITLSNRAFTGTVNFTITATNGAGSSVKTVSFVCKPPVEMITICHSQGGNPPQTISILQAEWSTHAAHGDTQGTCPVIEKPVVNITSPLSNQVTVENCVASVRATIDNVADKQSINVSHNGSQIDFGYSGDLVTISNYPFTGTANFLITATNEAGTSSQSVSFICQPPIEMITICHIEEGQQPQTQSVPATDWPTHEAHGDTQGTCPVIEKPVISISSPTTSPVTLENCVVNIVAIVQNVEDKQGLSVTQNGSPIAFGFSGNNLTVSNLSFEGTTSFVITATNGAGTSSESVAFICKLKKITICHYPPGNKENPQTISIPESAWSAHEGHGDSRGECPIIQPPVVTITSPRTSRVKVENCKASIQASVRNATESDITVEQDGSPISFTYAANKIRINNIDFTGTTIFTITVKNNAGSDTKSITYECEGEEDGEEEDKENEGDEEDEEEKKKEGKITICHYPPGNKKNPQTITISESAWPAHEKHGDTRGPCDN